MSKQYYIQNMGWGWFYACVFFYLSWDESFRYKTIILLVSSAGFILYPLAKWAIEWLFLKFTTREFWNSGLFIDTPGKMGMLAIYGCTVFLLSVPITVIVIITVLIKKLINK